MEEVTFGVDKRSGKSVISGTCQRGGRHDHLLSCGREIIFVGRKSGSFSRQEDQFLSRGRGSISFSRREDQFLSRGRKVYFFLGAGRSISSARREDQFLSQGRKINILVAVSLQGKAFRQWK